MALGSRTSWLAYGVCALLTAAVGDLLVEAFQNAGWLGTTAIDANHQGVVPILGLSAILFALLGVAIARERLRGSHLGHDDRLLTLAREVGRATLRMRLVTIVAWALVFVCATEEYERAFGGALPFDIAHASIGDAFVSLTIYVACATLVSIGLGAVMATIVASCDTLVAIVAMFATLAVREICVSTHRSRSHDTSVRRPYRRLSGPFGDRAPPAIR